MPGVFRVFAAVTLLFALGGSARAAGSGSQRLPDREIRQLLDDGHYAAAESLAWRLTGSARPGVDSLDHARALDLLVESLLLNGHMYRPEALSLADHAVGIRERHLGRDSRALVAPLLGQGRLLNELDQNDDAMRVLRRALSIEARASSPDSIELASVLDELGLTLWNVARDDEADSLFRQALGIRERLLPAGHPDRAASLVSLSLTAWDRGDVKQAIHLLEVASGQMEHALGPDHPRLGRALSLLALRKRFVQDPVAARQLYDRSLRILQRSLRPEHPKLAATLMFAADNLSVLGDLKDARPMLERSLVIRQRELPPDHPQIAWTMSSLGGWYAAVGDYATARKLLEGAVAMHRRAKTKDEMLEAIALRLLGSTLLCLGERGQSVRVFGESAAIYEKYFKVANPDLIWARLLVAEGDISNGDFDTARKLLARELPLAEQVAAKGDLLSNVYSLLGLAAAGERRWIEARKDFARAIDVAEKRPERSPFAYVAASMDLARTEDALGDYAGAETTLAPAIAVADSTFGLRGWTSGYGHLLLADVLTGLGRRGPALDAALTAQTAVRGMLVANLRYLPQEQGLRIVDLSARALGLALSLVTDPSGVSAKQLRETYDAVIRSRALVLDEASSRIRLRRQNPDSALSALEASMAQVSRRIANLEVRNATLDAHANDERLIREARGERDDLERRLAERVPAMAHDAEHRSIGFEELRRAIPASSALVSYACYERSRITEDQLWSSFPAQLASPPEHAAYLAFVLRPGQAIPVVVPLGPAPRLDSLIASYVAEASRSVSVSGRAAAASERKCRALGDRVRRALWDPVASHIGGADRVFVVLDGALQMVNLAALPAPGRGYLVEHGPTLHYLNAERDLATAAEASPLGRGLLALGDPEFDATSPMRAAVSDGGGRVVTAAVGGSEPLAVRSAPLSCEDFRSVRFTPLPAASQEIDAVAKIWARRKDRVSAADASLQDPATHAPEPLDFLQGRIATEEAFKRQAPGHRVLHLATHGFFYTGHCAAAWPGVRGIGRLVPSVATDSGRSKGSEDGSLLLSGLALAGANRRREAALDQEDGILTAEEITALDLTGVEWAVVSACESGAGAIRSGEGVFGLRRAFQEAGARTTVLSLWSADDRAARDWIQALYEARFLRGLPTADAARAASLAVIQGRRARGESTHPYFWGGFVASGDWR